MHAIVTPILKLVHTYLHDGREMIVHTTHPHAVPRQAGVVNRDMLNLSDEEFRSIRMPLVSTRGADSRTFLQPYLDTEERARERENRG